MKLSGSRVAIVGALDTLTRKAAGVRIAERGGVLRPSLSHRIDYAVFGHRMARTWPADRIENRIEDISASPARPVSETTLMRALDAAPAPPTMRRYPARDLERQGGIAADRLTCLTLFDAFDFAEEPFGMRDLIAARQYGRLLADGVSWPAIVRAVRTRGRRADGSMALSDVRLECETRDHVVMRIEGEIADLDGQRRLPLAPVADSKVDDLLDEAEAAETAGDWSNAAALYRRAEARDPDNPLIPFNFACAFMQQGNLADAAHGFHRTLKLDPGFAEAWYNLGSLARQRADPDAARRYLRRAIAADAAYADPVYNLALLEYETGDYAEAARLWTRYVDLDPATDWSKRARDGLRLIRLLGQDRGQGTVQPLPIRSMT